MLDHLKSIFVGLVAFLLCGMAASAIGFGIALVVPGNGYEGSAAILGWWVVLYSHTLAAFWFIGRSIRRKLLKLRMGSELE